jgi:hypothetical protein
MKLSKAELLRLYTLRIFFQKAAEGISKESSNLI